MIPEANLFSAKILIVDDQLISLRLMTSILHKAGYLHITTLTESENVIETYKRIEPDLMILDLNMPGADGFSVLKAIKEHEHGGYLPIIILSDERNPDSKYKALESGAKDFICKPFDHIEILIRIRNILEARLLNEQILRQNRIFLDKVKERTQALYDTQLDVIQRLARAVEYRDTETGMHVLRMSHYCACLAKKIGLTEEECELILTASPLHDIGKIAIPDHILLKNGPLTNDEREIMKRHTVIGGELLDGSDSKFLRLAREIALTHHERWDGLGYPSGLKNKEIPIYGRISCLCDVFDALMSKRSYKESWTLVEAIAEIQNLSGKMFDPNLVRSFLEVLPEINLIREKYMDPIEVDM